MAIVNTVLFDFSVDPGLAKTETSMSLLAANIEEVLKSFLSNVKLVNNFTLGGGLVKIFTAGEEVVINLRIFSSGLITLNIDHFKEENQGALFPCEKSQRLNRQIQDKISDSIKKSRPVIPVKRGDFCRYFGTSDLRLLEYDIDNLLFEEKSPYQKIVIAHSKTLGNMLILDEFQNIAESDLIYTETLMQRGKENYEGKEIVILGGGDGALLYELLKEKPKEVIMLEIDEVVMKACAKYMRSICGDVLDKYEGQNYKIIVGDCMKALEAFAREGRKFDYIFGDLTDTPISLDQSPELWALMNQALQLSLRVLKPDGKYMTHVTGAGTPQVVETYKQLLQKLSPPVTHTLDSAFVPSFLESWVFCQISFANQSKKRE